MFLTMEEIKEYYSGDKIQCLICDKWYKELGWHLRAKHTMSCDEYKSKFGLPWSRGLVSEELHIRKSEKAKELVANGKIAQHFNQSEFNELRKRGKRKKIQPFLKQIVGEIGKASLAIHRNPCPPGRKPCLVTADYEKYLNELKRTGKSILEIYKSGGFIHPNTLYKYAKKNKEFQKKLKAVSAYTGPNKR
jgi:hypothetical protein